MILPENYTMTKNGMFARLVVPEDAETIIALRSQHSARFMSTVDAVVENQKAWLRAYKERERQGLDYYFLYFVDGEPVGLNRVYNIKKDSFVGGSFVFKTGCAFELPILATVMQLDLAFNVLNLTVCFANIHKDNKKALKFNLLLGSDLIYDDATENFLLLTKNNFNTYFSKFEHLLQV